jgi:hypothetical protein
MLAENRIEKSDLASALGLGHNISGHLGEVTALLGRAPKIIHLCRGEIAENPLPLSR